MRGRSASRERHSRSDAGLGVLLRENFFRPSGDRLRLDCHARRMAQEAVRAREVRPRGCHRLGIHYAVKGFQFAANLRLLWQCRSGRGPRGFGARVSHAHQRRLRAASADGEIHRAIPPDDRVGHGQRRAGHERFRLGLVTCAVGPQMNREDAAVSPVERINGALILRRKFRARSTRHASRRAGTDFEHGRQVVFVIRRRIARAAAPAEVAAAHDVADARGPIPRQAHVPFHVRVVGEEIAVGV